VIALGCGKDFYYGQFAFAFKLLANAMRHDFAGPGVSVFNFRQDHRKAGLQPSGEAAERLSPGLSIIVIAALSALSWAVLIALVVAVQQLL
jgi:hypothetical protein